MTKSIFSSLEEILAEDFDIPDIESMDNSSQEELKSNVVNFDSYKLCQFVVAYRYINYNKELAICAMQELGKRRASGDNFAFESVIESSLAELPELNFELPDLRSIVSQFSSVKK